MNCIASTSRVMLDGVVGGAAGSMRRAARRTGVPRAGPIAGHHLHTSRRRLAEVTLATSSPSAPPSSSPDPLSSVPAALRPPQVHPRTHNIHVASLHLSCAAPEPLVTYTDFALHAAHALGIPASRPASLPTTKSLYTVIKSPFVHKKSQENFERKTHRRVIKVWDADRAVLDKWARYLQQYGIAGVGMKMQVYEWADVAELSGDKASGLKKQSTQDKVLEAAGVATRDLEGDARAGAEGKGE